MRKSKYIFAFKLQNYQYGIDTYIIYIGIEEYMYFFANIPEKKHILNKLEPQSNWYTYKGNCQNLNVTRSKRSMDA